MMKQRGKKTIAVILASITFFGATSMAASAGWAGAAFYVYKNGGSVVSKYSAKKERSGK